MSNDEAVARAEARGPTPAEALANAESLRRVRAVLEQLEERGRAILILVDLEGSSCVEVAEALNIPIGTVYSRLHGARKRFADAYEKLTKEVGSTRSGGAA
jgi:RNA polymerase sigma-70 factor (ECF subfamily)